MKQVSEIFSVLKTISYACAGHEMVHYDFLEKQQIEKVTASLLQKLTLCSVEICLEANN